MTRFSNSLRMSGGLLIVGFGLSLAGAFMFWGTDIFGWFLETSGYIAWERGLFIAAYVVSAVGVGTLELAMSGAVLARIGAWAFLMAAAVAVVVEASFLSVSGSAGALEVLMVVMLFVAEAILGAALLRTGLVPDWTAWTVIVLNVGALAGLLSFSSSDLYYPLLHFVPLLLIGVPIASRGSHSRPIPTGDPQESRRPPKIPSEP